MNVKFLLRLLITAAALYAATRFVDGIRYTGEPVGLLAVALVFGVVNGFIAPVVKFFALPLIFLSIGFFLLVINGFMLLLTARLSAVLGLGFSVSGFGAAFWGAVVVSIVSLVLSTLVPEDKDRA